MLVGVVPGGPGADHAGPELQQALLAALWRGGGQEDRARHAELLRRQGHPDAVVAPGGGEDPGGRGRGAGQQRVQRAAQLEGEHGLLVLPFDQHVVTQTL